MTDEKGYLQFDCEWERVDAIEYDRLGEIILWRRLLHEERLVGVDKNGVGYGNVSERVGDSETFVITATQTGHLKDLSAGHFSIVTESDVAQNRIRCAGAIPASSESLSHAILYHADKQIGAVVHVHNPETWERLRGRVPTTDPAAEAGTVAMANEIERVFASLRAAHPAVIVMGGHRDGLLSFGRDVGEATVIMLQACGRSIPERFASQPAFDR